MALWNNSRWDDAFQIVDEVTGDPIDLTGKNLAMGLSDELHKSAPDLILSTANTYLQITDAVQGRFKFNVPYAITSDMNRGKYYFDIVELLAGGDQLRLISGSLEVSHGVTRNVPSS